VTPSEARISAGVEVESIMASHRARPCAVGVQSASTRLLHLIIQLYGKCCQVSTVAYARAVMYTVYIDYAISVVGPIMPRWGITVTDEMDEAMKRVAEKRGATISNLVRQVIADFLVENGEDVETKVTWGGAREDESSIMQAVNSAGQILVDLTVPHEAQIHAANALANARGRWRQAALAYLIQASSAHETGHGLVQLAILEALSKLGIVDATRLLSETHRIPEGSARYTAISSALRSVRSKLVHSPQESDFNIENEIEES
jgi:hypothetical protein